MIVKAASGSCTRPGVIRRRFLCLLLLPLSVCRAGGSPGSADTRAAPLTASEFARVIERISEEGGYFWNENFVSNEASYLHPLGKLRELGVQGGAYVGVGPDQNLTYIAKLRPRIAFVVDIRRQNMLQHLLFKALFHLARDRRDYLSLLISRPVRRPFALADEYGVQQLVDYFRGVDPDPALYSRTELRVRSFLGRAGRLRLSAGDLETIAKVHRAFYLRGLSIKYDYVPVPTFGEFLLERDLDGRQQNFLNSERDFRVLKVLHEENRIIPVVGDFAGAKAVREIGNYLRERGEKLTVFYASNVEQYLLRNQSWQPFVRNLSTLPVDEHAVFIRAYWGSRMPHPDQAPGYRFTQVIQWIRPFLQNFDPRRQYTYFELVTTDTIRLQ